MLEQRRTLESWTEAIFDSAQTTPFQRFHGGQLCYFCRKHLLDGEVYVSITGRTSMGVRVLVHGHKDCAVSMGYIW